MRPSASWILRTATKKVGAKLKSEPDLKWRETDVNERLNNMHLVHGITQYIEDDTEEARRVKPATRSHRGATHEWHESRRRPIR